MSSESARIGGSVRLLAVLAALAAYQPTYALYACGLVAPLLLLQRPAHIRPTAVDFAAITLAAWTWLSTWWAQYPDTAQRAAITQSLLVAVFLAARHTIRTREQLRHVAKGFIVGAVIAVLSVVAQNPGVLAGLGQERYGVEGLNFNTLAFALVDSLALVVLLWHTRRSSSGCGWLVVVAIVLVVGVLMTGTRSALLAVALLIVWIVGHRVAPRAALTAATAAIGWLGWQIVAGGGVAFLTNFEGSRRSGDLSGRVGIWEKARHYWSEEPLLGHGASFYQMTNPDRVAAHNVILDLAVGLGVAGVAVFLWLLWATFVREPRSVPSPTRPLLVGAFLVVSAPLILSGVWLPQPTSWLALALFTRLPALGTAAGLAPTIRSSASSRRR